MRPPSYAVEKPQRSPNLVSDVAVPLLQAIVTALVLGTGVVTLLWGVWGIRYWPTWPIVTAALFVFAWIWRLLAVSETLFITEKFLGMDLDGNGVVGDPAQDHDHIIVAAGSATASMDPRQEKRAAFIEFVRACGTGDTSRERFKVLGRDRYVEFRDLLIRAHLARWRSETNHRLGWELSVPANDIINDLV